MSACMIIPSNIDPTDKIIYNHIPKCAGTSVNHYFLNTLGPEQVGWLGIDFTHEDLREGRGFGRFRVVGGHFTRRAAAAIPGNKVFLSTIREPISRVVSYHRYIMRIENHPMQAEMTGDFDRDIDGPFGEHVTNQQCVFLGEEPTSLSALRSFDDSRSGLALVDDIDKFLPLISELLGCPPAAVPTVNAGDIPPPIESATREKLHELLLQDTDLFNRLKLSSVASNPDLQKAPKHDERQMLRPMSQV